MGHNDPFKGKTVTADWAYDLSRATTYTPALTAVTTDPNLGDNGTITGWYHQNGHLIVGGALIQFSDPNVAAGSGRYEISLPISANTSLLTASGGAGLGTTIGTGYLQDNSTTANSEIVAAQLGSADVLIMVFTGSGVAVSDSSPFTWATSDRITVNFAYVADSSSL